MPDLANVKVLLDCFINTYLSTCVCVLSYYSAKELFSVLCEIYLKNTKYPAWMKCATKYQYPMIIIHPRTPKYNTSKYFKKT